MGTRLHVFCSLAFHTWSLHCLLWSCWYIMTPLGSSEREMHFNILLEVILCDCLGVINLLFILPVLLRIFTTLINYALPPPHTHTITFSLSVLSSYTENGARDGWPSRTGIGASVVIHGAFTPAFHYRGRRCPYICLSAL